MKGRFLRGAGHLLRVAAALLAFTGNAPAADLTIGLSSDVTSLDPQYVAIQPNVTIGWHVFDALTRVDEHARLIPGLVVSWRAIDAPTWEFKSRGARARGRPGRCHHSAVSPDRDLGDEEEHPLRGAHRRVHARPVLPAAVKAA